MQGAPVRCDTPIYPQAVVLERDVGTIVCTRHYLYAEEVSVSGRDLTAVDFSSDADTSLEQFCLPPAEAPVVGSTQPCKSKL
jgi:hypothetical protein